MTHIEIELIHLLDERSEEALTMIAAMENLPIERLQAMIDMRRNARTGFGQAVKIFTVAYFRAVLEDRYKNYGRAPRASKLDRRSVIDRVFASQEFQNANDDT